MELPYPSSGFVGCADVARDADGGTELATSAQGELNWHKRYSKLFLRQLLFAPLPHPHKLWSAQSAKLTSQSLNCRSRCPQFAISAREIIFSKLCSRALLMQSEYACATPVAPLEAPSSMDGGHHGPENLEFAAKFSHYSLLDQLEFSIVQLHTNDDDDCYGPR